MTKVRLCKRLSFKDTSFLFKPLLIMKLTAILLTAAFLNVSASGVSQNVTFKEKKAKLEKVFQIVERQTGYFFLYPKNVLEISQPVSANVVNMPLVQFLDVIFKGQPLRYSISSRTINVFVSPGSDKISSNPPNTIGNTVVVEEAPVKQVIRGLVQDDAGNPLPGATVQNKNSKQATVSDSKGLFAIEVNESDVLEVSYVQHETKEIKLTLSQITQGFITITLIKSLTEEKEITIKTGIFQKVDKSYTGASTTVSGKQLQQFGNRNLLVSLKNIDPSFNIIENIKMGSDPNHMPEVLIRGNSSLPNISNLDELAGLNTPLIILDGFQSTLEKMLDININEVESVTLLKDAAATAIYGSRGSNGVLVITTKQPTPGTLKVSYRADLNIEVADLSDYNLLEAREKLELEKKMGFYDHATASEDIRKKTYYNFLLNEVNQSVNTNWLTLPLQTGIGQRHNLSLSGGENAFMYSLSAQINNIEGVMKGSNRNTFNGTVNLSYIFKKIRFSNRLMISEGRSTESPYGVFSDYVKLNPYWRAFDEKGNALKVLGDPGNNSYQLNFSQLPTSPLYNATLTSFNKTRRSDLINNTLIELTLAEGLSMRGQFGIAKRTSTSDKFRPAEHTAFTNYRPEDVFRKGDYNYGTSNGFDYDGSLNLQYSKIFSQKHTLFTGVDYNIRQAQLSSLAFLAEGFANASLNNISMALQYAKDQKPGGSESLVRSMGLTANANYIFNDLYFADVSFRMDGSSQFGKNNRMAPFWALGVGWNLHNEPFLKGSNVIEKLKLRGSVGTTGSQNFYAYQALSTYRYYPNDRYYSWNGAFALGMGNENLKWQQALTYDIGFNAEFLKNRLQLTGDYYITDTRNLLSSIELPASNGYPSYVENVGEMMNRGFELKATGILIRQPANGFYWSVSASVFQNRNKIVRTSKALKDAQKNRQMQQTDVLSALYFEGYSTNAIWVVPSLGIDPSNGKEVYLGADGRPTYIWNGNDLRAMGNTDPKYMGTFSTLLRYSNFTLNASFGYRLGGQQYNQTLISKVENANYTYNVDARVYTDRWENPGDIAAFKGLKVVAATNRSSRFVQDESTLACQNVYLEYLLKSNYLRTNINLNYLQFTLGMAEPFRISTIRQERGTSYPFSRQFSFSISANF